MQFIDLAAQQRRIRPQLDEALARVLDHGRYIMGPEVAALEADLAAFVGEGEVVSCASGTDALVMALLARGAGSGTAVFVPSFTFAATAEAVALLGATPVFVDIDPVTYNLDPASLDAAVRGLDPGLQAAGVIPVDLFGLPADYAAIDAVCADHGLWVIADAAQGFGGSVGDRRVGRFAPLTTTSFFPAKPLGCYGDGGAIVALDPDDAKVLRSIRVHGSGSDKYDNVRLGINGRLDTIQAAILIEKLRLFPEELELRAQVAATYTAGLEGVVATPTVPAGVRSAWAQYTVRVDDRDIVAKALGEAGIPTAVYYPLPLHRQQAYSRYPVGAGGMAASDRAADQVLSLPMHPYLEAADQQRIIEVLLDATAAAR
ncbi:DegT/DnrJ/EryC1/StrS family aminotransferase [Aquihabitans sp. McL0605]|uniref:DegT/DnrJ/EryC1/StrS family aminotransferase n=1 Tax=Aquihabitans sp. McL0605 TaxID=3415671 RepID=UPI003CE8BAB4